MTRRPSDSELSRLLAGRDEPSVLEREAVFDAVMADVEPKRRRPWAIFAVPLLAVAALAIAVMARPDAPAPSEPVVEFGVRGPTTGNLALHCLRESAPGPCARGSVLLFDVTPDPNRPYFAAFGRRADGVIVWYLPPAGASSTQERGVAKQGFAIGPEHGPGSLEVFGLFTSRAMTRAQLKAALGDTLEPTDEVGMVKRALEVVE